MAETLGDRLKTARGAKGLSQQEVADAVGVNRVRVSTWENDGHKPSAENLNALAALFGTTSRTLLTGEPDIQPRTENVSRGTLSEPFAIIPRHARNLPLSVREFLAEFRLRLTKGGATDEEIAEADKLLLAPDVFSYFAGGKLNEYDEEDVLDGMRSMAEAVVRRLKRKGRKIR